MQIKSEHFCLQNNNPDSATNIWTTKVDHYALFIIENRVSRPDISTSLATNFQLVF